MTDHIRLFAAAVLLIAGIVGFYMLSDFATALRVSMVLVGAGLAVAVVWRGEQGQRLLTFFGESIKEARKVVWPTRKETLQTTAIVFLFVVVMAFLLWLVDAGLMSIIKWMMGRSDS